MAVARLDHGAALLPNGDVLVAGGSTPLVNLSSAELYHPSTNTWTMTGSLLRSRTGFAKAQLQNGSAIIAGGQSVPQDDSELYNPATGRWSLAAPYPGFATSFLVTLTDGSVLALGGGSAL
jgi:hypothetical protein